MATRKVLMIVTVDGRAWEIGLGQLFQVVRSGLAQALVFQEIAADGTVRWELRFSVAPRVPAGVAQQSNEAE